ncbi:hypothetical protein Clacol_006029 [Clathrus columnatus]|uniref:Uncharacterized protein n=1 Tax=Clathrus columnatus TaxID=1419009 RepID=A0AAV5AAX7_9AGAM|nr:hypothetical protein Clacol_006029 [Clathrus columnatus]
MPIPMPLPRSLSNLSVQKARMRRRGSSVTTRTIGLSSSDPTPSLSRHFSSNAMELTRGKIQSHIDHVDIHTPTNPIDGQSEFIEFQDIREKPVSVVQSSNRIEPRTSNNAEVQRTVKTVQYLPPFSRRRYVQLIFTCYSAFMVGIQDGSLGPLLPTIQRVYHLLGQIQNIVPEYILSPTIGWIVLWSNVGISALPFVEGALATRFGMGSLQPLYVRLLCFRFPGSQPTPPFPQFDNYDERVNNIVDAHSYENVPMNPCNIML